MQVRSC